MIVKTWSGCRIGVVWYDSEAEAEARATQIPSEPGVAEANIGFAQCGRDRARDTVVDGRPAYAVVIP